MSDFPEGFEKMFPEAVRLWREREAREVEWGRGMRMMRLRAEEAEKKAKLKRPAWRPEPWAPINL